MGTLEWSTKNSQQPTSMRVFIPHRGLAQPGEARGNCALGEISRRVDPGQAGPPEVAIARRPTTSPLCRHAQRVSRCASRLTPEGTIQGERTVWYDLLPLQSNPGPTRGGPRCPPEDCRLAAISEATHSSGSPIRRRLGRLHIPDRILEWLKRQLTGVLEVPIKARGRLGCVKTLADDTPLNGSGRSRTSSIFGFKNRFRRTIFEAKSPGAGPVNFASVCSERIQRK
jgi:hypothetical protein